MWVKTKNDLPVTYTPTGLSAAGKLCLSPVKTFWIFTGETWSRWHTGPCGAEGRTRRKSEWTFFSHLSTPKNKTLRDVGSFVLLFQGSLGYPGERGIRGEPVGHLRPQGYGAIAQVHVWFYYCSRQHWLSYSNNSFQGSPGAKGEPGEKGLPVRKHLLMMLTSLTCPIIFASHWILSLCV